MERCKGSRDLLPEDMLRFRYIEQAFRSCCLEWGYKEIRTPSLEYLHLFTSTGTLTPSILNSVYSFLDWDGWSGERVVLRPDGTIPAVRLYIDNLQESCQAKLFYIENTFNFEETGQKSRERWQCGVEMIGYDRPSADIELMSLALETLSKLNIEGAELYLSHAGLVKALLQEAGLSPIEQSQVLERILDGDTEVLKNTIRDNPQLSDSTSLLFELKGKSPGFLENLKATIGKVSPDLEKSIENFINITHLLSEMGCEYQIDIASARGFEYYTGIIFQLYLEGIKIGGGGRYNNLVPLLGGGNIPASGFALYIDQLMNSLPIENWDNDRQMVIVKSNFDSAGEWKLSLEVARFLRELGYIVELDQDSKETNGYRWVLIIRSGEKPSFILTDQISGKSTGTESPAGILSILQETKVNEASSS